MKRYMVSTWQQAAALAATFVLGGAPAWAQDGAPDGAEVAAESTTETAQPSAQPQSAQPQSAQPTGPEGTSAREQGPVLGPGGRPLRTDYPGTAESLQARMEVEGIEGLQVDTNEPGAAYGLRIRELETRIDDLKEHVFQSKARIVLLRETLLSGNLAGARAVITHTNELGGTWNIEQAYYALDGTKLANRTDRDRDVRRTFQVYEGSVSPGSHSLNVLIKYRGSNVGVFPYFKKYNGDIRSSCDFRAEEGKVAQIHVSVYPKGGIAQTIEERPQVKCDVKYFENLRPASTDATIEQGEQAAQQAPVETDSP